jgi:hypothetical protein
VLPRCALFKVQGPLGLDNRTACVSTLLTP